ncbi:MAG: kelch repeat-containing protein [Planctomycetota bacterium]
MLLPALVAGATSSLAQPVQPLVEDTITRPLPVGETVGFLPRGLTSFGSAVVDGYLYVIGGYFGTPHDYSIEGQSAAFLRINLHDTRDVRLLPDVTPVQSVELVRYGDKLVRVAGMHARNTEDEPTDLQSSTTVEMFDPLAEEWIDLPDLPEPRSSHRAVVVGDTLFVAGGWALLGGTSRSGSEWRDDVLALDLTAPEDGWASIPAPFQARALGAASAGGKLVIVGGIKPNRGGISKEVRIYDPATDTWSEGPEFPDFGFGITAVESGGRVLASGRSGDVHALDVEAMTWTHVASLTTGRIFHELVASEAGDLFALGGITGMNTSGRIRAIERVDLSGSTAVSGIERFTIPAPGSARNRHGIVVKNRSMYLFGGNSSLGAHALDETDFVDEVWRFDLGSLAWTRLTSMPAPRQAMEAAIVSEGEKIIAVGGLAHDGEAAKTTASAMFYEFEFDDWVEGPALPASRVQAGMVAREGELWVFGGGDFDGSQGTIQLPTSVLRWDGESDAFAEADVEIPRSRRGFAGAMVGDRYMLVGGVRDGFELVEEADVYDFSTGVWSTCSAPAKPRLTAECVVLDGSCYLVGGMSKGADGEMEANRSIEVYDAEADAWRVLVPDVGFDTSFARAFAVDGKILIFTMHSEGDTRADLAIVDPSRFPRSN